MSYKDEEFHSISLLFFKFRTNFFYIDIKNTKNFKLVFKTTIIFVKLHFFATGNSQIKFMEVQILSENFEKHNFSNDINNNNN